MNPYKGQVLLSSYNGERYLTEQIDSLMTQEGVDIHIIIRDDGSVDNSCNIINEYVDRYPERITFYRRNNIGVKQSFFDLINKSNEEFDYFAFCDQDDVWDNRKILNALTLMMEDDLSKPILYCSTTKIVNSELQFIKQWPNQPIRDLTIYNAVVENIAVGCTMVLNRELMMLVKSNLPKDYSNIIMHDWWIHLCASCFGKVIFDPRPSILYRQHSHNVLGGQTESFFGKWKKKFTRFISNYYGNMVSNQAQEFYNIYKNSLTDKKKSDIYSFIVQSDRNIINRICYVVRMPMYKQSRLDSFLFKIKYVLRKI